MTDADFQQALAAAPNQIFAWLLWADWLEETGRPQEAELVRLRTALTQSIEVVDRRVKEDRLRELLYSYQVPTLTVVHHNSLGMIFSLIPPGEFMFGTPPAESRRGPRYHLYVSRTVSQSFYLSIHLVKQYQYERIMEINPSSFSTYGEFHRAIRNLNTRPFPVENVSPIAALEFCRRLTERERQRQLLPSGWHYTLPTEIQWEYACRAGTTSRTYFGAGLAPKLANVSFYFGQSSSKEQECNIGRPTPAGNYPANAFGLFDMLGNVAEWCRSSRTATNTNMALIKSTAPSFLARGGSWSTSNRDVRSDSFEVFSESSSDPKEWFSPKIGFRPILVPESSHSE